MGRQGMLRGLLVLLIAGCDPTPVLVNDPGYACAVGVRHILANTGGSVQEADRMFDRCLREASRRANPRPAEDAAADLRDLAGEIVGEALRAQDCYPCCPWFKGLETWEAQEACCAKNHLAPCNPPDYAEAP